MSALGSKAVGSYARASRRRTPKQTYGNKPARSQICQNQTSGEHVTEARPCDVDQRVERLNSAERQSSPRSALVAPSVALLCRGCPGCCFCLIGFCLPLG